MSGASFHKLNKAVAELIDGFSMVSFLKLDVQDEDSLNAVLSYMTTPSSSMRRKNRGSPRNLMWTLTPSKSTLYNCYAFDGVLVV